MLGFYLLSGWAFCLCALSRRTPFTSVTDWRFTWSGALIGTAIVITGSMLAYVVLGVLAVSAPALCPVRTLPRTREPVDYRGPEGFGMFEPSFPEPRPAVRVGDDGSHAVAGSTEPPSRWR